MSSSLISTSSSSAIFISKKESKNFENVALIVALLLLLENVALIQKISKMLLLFAFCFFTFKKNLHLIIVSWIGADPGTHQIADYRSANPIAQDILHLMLLWWRLFLRQDWFGIALLSAKWLRWAKFTGKCLFDY